MFNPNPVIRSVPICAGHSCYVIDDALADPDAWVERAVRHRADFAMEGHNAYPGIELAMPDGISERLRDFFALHIRQRLVARRIQRAHSRLSIVKPQKVQPAIVEFVDIAGLMAGASKGEGLGNKFLANIRETDGIVNMVRCFADDNVVNVAGKVDPISDIEVIQTELSLADLATIEKALQRESKVAKSGNKEAIKLCALLEMVQAHLDRGKPARTLGLDKEQQQLLQPLCLLTAKPAI